VTPYELRILLDIHIGTPLSVETDAPIFEDTIADLVQRGYAVPFGDAPRPMGLEYASTAKLTCLMQHILSLPDPLWGMP
jgi:hypothetical protein